MKKTKRRKIRKKRGRGTEVRKTEGEISSVELWIRSSRSRPRGRRRVDNEFDGRNLSTRRPRRPRRPRPRGRPCFFIARLRGCSGSSASLFGEPLRTRLVS